MDFDDDAQTWDDRPERVARSAAVAAAVRAAVDLTDRPATLELGAGTGLLSRQLATDLGPVTLVDASAGMVEVARVRIAEIGLVGWRAVQADVLGGMLPEGPFGLVLTQLALHHLADVPAALRAAYDVLAPGGRIAIADLDEDPTGDFHAEHPDFHGHHGFRREDIADWLTAAGFGDVDVRTATHAEKTVRDETRGFPIFLATARRPI